MSEALRGRRVMVTRPEMQAGALVLELRNRGATVVAVPVIAIEDLVDMAELRAACGRATDIVLTSANAARHLVELADVLTGRVRVWAVGPRTVQALRRAGIQPERSPSDFTASALAGELLAGDTSRRHFLLLQAEMAPGLADRLREAGVKVETLAMYRTVSRPDAAAALDVALAAGIDAITFLSGSAVAATVAAIGSGTRLNGVVIACIGEATAAVARRLGLHVDVVARVHTGAGLVDALAGHLA